MRLASPFISQLRRSRKVGWFAVWLIALQIAGAAEHLSAVAAATAGAPADGRLGFLNICTARGAVAADADRANGLMRSAFPNACALCAMDAMAGNGITVDAGTAPVPPSSSSDELCPAIYQLPTAVALRYGAVRGPPLPSAI